MKELLIWVWNTVSEGHLCSTFSFSRCVRCQYTPCYVSFNTRSIFIIPFYISLVTAHCDNRVVPNEPVVARLCCCEWFIFRYHENIAITEVEIEVYSDLSDTLFWNFITGSDTFSAWRLVPKGIHKFILFCRNTSFFFFQVTMQQLWSIIVRPLNATLMIPSTTVTGLPVTQNLQPLILDSRTVRNVLNLTQNSVRNY